MTECGDGKISSSAREAFYKRCTGTFLFKGWELEGRKSLRPDRMRFLILLTVR